MMKILFLGNDDVENNPLVHWVREQGEEVVPWYTQLNKDMKIKLLFGEIDFIISYGYGYILPKEILDLFPKKVINLHTSYLPWNRGADPNFWGWYDDTPKGVSIHYIDEGVDTGEIIAQVPVLFLKKENQTLRTTYDRLHEEIQTLFKMKWHKIKPEHKNEGSYHSKKEGEELIASLPKGWDTLVSEVSKMKEVRG